MRFLKQILGLLSTGYILVFYSEFMFWARVRPEDSWPGWLTTWLVYSLLGFILLTLISRFRLRSIWALFLGGAVFGWLTEGVVVQTAYAALPLSISFTGLAWHALISVWVGWYAVRKTLHISARSTALLASAIGLGYGFWAINWWVALDGSVAQPIDFALFALTTTLLLMLAYLIYDRTIPTFFAPNRKAEIVVAVLVLLQFVLTAVPAAPIAVVIFPVLMVLLYIALRYNQQAESRSALLQASPGAVPAINYLCLLLLPAIATAFYAAAFAFGWRWHTNWVVYLVTTPLGFILLAVSLIKVWRMKPVASSPNEAI